jgi:hypothetical protein
MSYEGAVKFLGAHSSIKKPDDGAEATSFGGMTSLFSAGFSVELSACFGDFLQDENRATETRTRLRQFLKQNADFINDYKKHCLARGNAIVD